MRADENSGYAEFYTVYIKREENDPEIRSTTLSLTIGKEYTLLINKPYFWQLTIDGMSCSYTKFTPLAGETNTIAIVASGGDTSSIFLVV